MATILKEYKKHDSQNKNRTFVEFQCDCCNKPHTMQKRHFKNENFCSSACSNKYRNKLNRTEIKCAVCNKVAYRRNSQLRNSKSGLYFCCRKCKDMGQRLISNLPQIQPPHYGKGNGKYHYRDDALKNLPNKCANCGYDRHVPVLQVHHKDCNRQNNKLDNLEILCPTCHLERHFLSKTGLYATLQGD